MQRIKPIKFVDINAFSRQFFDRFAEICSSFVRVIDFEAANSGIELDTLNVLFKMPKLAHV